MRVGRTPLHYAALHGRASAVEELIKQGAAHEAKDNRGGYTPLHLAADAGQCEVISRLCEMGAHLEAVSTKGWTPLALANMKVRIAACCEPAANMLQLAESARASRCFCFTVTDTVCKDYSVLRLDVMQCVCVLSMPHCLMCCPGLSLIILYRNTCQNQGSLVNSIFWAFLTHIRPSGSKAAYLCT